MQFELFRTLPPATDQGSTRHLVLAGRIVGYALRRDRRRLTLRIDERGLRVGAPPGLPLTDIDAFIRHHAGWVIGKLDEYARQSAPRYLPIHDGCRVPLLGREARILVTAGNNRGYWRAGDDGSDELWLAARPQADLPALARRALQRRALEEFRPRLESAAGRLGVPVPPLALSSARTRWGSCSTRSGIRLNWRLVHLPVALVDYVIAHETAHLLEMNHGARFWSLVGRLCPDWRPARAELKRQGAALPLL